MTPITSDEQALAVLAFTADYIGDSFTHGLREAHAYLATRLAKTGPAVDGWLPIETAPKDGITQTLFFEQGDVYVGYRPIDCPDDSCCDLDGIACYATHWRPLPEPPTAALEARG